MSKGDSSVIVKDKHSLRMSNGIAHPPIKVDDNVSDSDPDEDYTRFLSRPPKKLSTSLNGGNVSVDGVSGVGHSAPQADRVLPVIKLNQPVALQSDSNHHVDSPSSGEFSEHSLKENMYLLDEGKIYISRKNDRPL